jgi:putative endonuclease
MPSFVYVLGCQTPDRHLTYVGWTTDVVRRLAQHNGGRGARTTRGRFWVLLYTEKFRTRRQAMSREWFLKRDRKFRKQIALHKADRAACGGGGCVAGVTSFLPLSHKGRGKKELMRLVPIVGGAGVDLQRHVE